MQKFTVVKLRKAIKVLMKELEGLDKSSVASF